MKKIKLTNSIFAGILVSTSVMIPAAAQVPENELTSSSLSVMAQTLEDADIKSVTENSITFTDDSTLTLQDNYYISTDEDGQEFKITKVDDNKVQYENLQTGEVNYAIKNTEIIQEKPGFSTNAEITSDGFKYKGMVKNSTEIVAANKALIAGILVGFVFMGQPAIVGGIMGTLASVSSYYVSLKGDRAYWIEKTYSKAVQLDNFRVQVTIRKDFHYYKYHDYTAFIGTVSTIQHCGNGGCGPIEYME